MEPRYCAVSGKSCTCNPRCEDEDADLDVCVHGRPFDSICVECCPEDDDGTVETRK